MRTPIIEEGAQPYEVLHSWLVDHYRYLEKVVDRADTELRPEDEALQETVKSLRTLLTFVNTGPAGRREAPPKGVSRSLWARIVIVGECWQWIGAGVNGVGSTGCFTRDGKVLLVHRELWDIYYPDQPLRKYEKLYPLCSTDRCVRPMHFTKVPYYKKRLEAVKFENLTYPDGTPKTGGRLAAPFQPDPNWDLLTDDEKRRYLRMLRGEADLCELGHPLNGARARDCKHPEHRTQIAPRRPNDTPSGQPRTPSLPNTAKDGRRVAAYLADRLCTLIDEGAALAQYAPDRLLPLPR